MKISMYLRPSKEKKLTSVLFLQFHCQEGCLFLIVTLMTENIEIHIHLVLLLQPLYPEIPAKNI